MEKKRKLLKFLFDYWACLSCIPVSYCGVFTDEETCLKCLDDGLTELLQHNVNNRRELLCAFFKYFRDNGEANIGMTIEQFVDAFLSTQ